MSDHQYTHAAAVAFEGIFLAFANVAPHLTPRSGMMSAGFARGLRSALEKLPGVTHAELAADLRKIAAIVERSETGAAGTIAHPSG